MPKIIEYPKATLKNSLELASAVYSLGGKSSVELAADKLNKKLGGAWQALVASAVRYGLIDSKKGSLEVTPLYTAYKLAYNETEANQALAKAFLMPGIFQSIVVRFEGMKLPVSHFENLLIREFGVPNDRASRVTKYFLEGARQVGILDSDDKIDTSWLKINQHNDSYEQPSDEDDFDEETDEPSEKEPKTVVPIPKLGPDTQSYSVQVVGPGINSVVTINEEEDLMIVEIMLKKIKKKLNQNDENTK
jgi:hypothetical protein